MVNTEIASSTATDTHVDDHQIAATIHHQVGRLEVAVQDLGLRVRILQRLAKLSHPLRQLRRLEHLSSPLRPPTRQRFARHVLHRHGLHSALP